MDIGTILTGLGGLTSIISTFKWVNEGEIGVMTTFGKASRNRNGKVNLIGSGFRFILPIIQKIVKAHIYKNTENYSELTVTLKNGLTYRFSAFMVYHVKSDPDSIESILFQLEDYREYVCLTFEKAIQHVLQEVVTLNPEKFNLEIKDKVSGMLGSVGIEVDDCGLISFSATEISQGLLGMNYKIQTIRENKDINTNLMSAVLGSMPVLDTSSRQTNDENSEEE